MHDLNYPTLPKPSSKRLRETLALTILLCSPFFSITIALIFPRLFYQFAPHFLQNLNRTYHVLETLIFLTPALGIVLGLFFLALAIHRLSRPSRYLLVLIPTTLNILWLLLILSLSTFHLN